MSTEHSSRISAGTSALQTSCFTGRIFQRLCRARYGRNKTRFVTVPPDLDMNANNAAIVHAALAAGLYPKILAVDPLKGEMRTITNNQPASFHPSSVNFKRRLGDFGVNHLCYFTLM